MAIYLVVFVLSALLIYLSETCKFKKWSRRLIIFLAILIPSLLAGLRSYEIGGDTADYGVFWFNEATKYDNWLEFIKHAKGYSIDYGYATVNYIASLFGNDAHIFLFIHCFFELLLFYYAVKPYCCKGALSLSFMIYFLLYYNDSLNNLRQFPAILIILFSYRFIRDKKLIPFLFCVALASTFHITAVFALVLYPISWLAETKYSKMNLILISLLIIVACVSFEQIFNLLGLVGLNLSRYEHYLYDAESGGKYVRLFLFGAIWLLYILNKDKYKKYLNNLGQTNTFLFFSTISLSFTSLMFLGMSNFIIRLSYYFDFFLLIYLPGIIQMKGTVYCKDGHIKITINFFAVTTLLFVYWIFTYAIRNGASTIPYKFYWN